MDFEALRRDTRDLPIGVFDSGIGGLTVLEALPLETYKQFDPLFEADVYEAIDLKTCVEKRVSAGGPTVASVEAQIAHVKQYLEK